MYIKGLRDIVDRYDVFFVDMCGVLVLISRAIEGSYDALRTLKNAGKKVILVTNAEESAENILYALEYVYGFAGIRDVLDHVVTAGEVFLHVSEKWNFKKPTRIYLWGDYYFLPQEKTMTHITQNEAFQVVKEYQNADLVLCFKIVTGLEEHQMYTLEEKDRDLLKHIRDYKVPMIVPNDDIVAPDKDGSIAIAAGFFAREYSEMGGEVFSTGKPATPIFALAHQKAEKPAKTTIVMVGDTLETDIVGARDFGVDSVLITGGNFGGESAFVEHELTNIQPTWILDKFVY